MFQKRSGRFALLCHACTLLLIFLFFAHCSQLGIERVYNQDLSADPTLTKTTIANQVGPEKSQLSLQLLDLAAPNHLQKVLVNLSHINLHAGGNNWFTIADFGPEGHTVDLLAVSAHDLAELTGIELSAGTYQAVEFVLGNHFALVEVKAGYRGQGKTLKMYAGENIMVTPGFTIQANHKVTHSIAFELALQKNKCLQKKRYRWQRIEGCRTYELSLSGTIVNTVTEPIDNGPDTDGDGTPDIADSDDDNDGVLDFIDNCPFVVNPAQIDSDGDGLGNACDETPGDEVPVGNDNGGGF